MRHLALLAACAVLAAGSPALASKKPCRDAHGRIVKCEEPRKPVTRCKDAQGRFVRCDTPGAKPLTGSPPS